MFKSITRTRRRNILLGKISAAFLIALCAAALLFFFALRDERIRDYQVEVAVQNDGTALVRERITYDFGSAQRHGIKRIIPGYHIDSAGAESTFPGEITDAAVRSDSAPDEALMSGSEIRVGDPNATVSGEHTYEITYRLPDAVQNGSLGLDVIGSAWEVPIDSADVTVRAPFELVGATCKRGQEFSTDPCSGFRADGSTVTVHADDLGEGEGISVFAGKGATAGDSPALSTPGELPSGDEYWWLWRMLLIIGVGAAGYVIGLIPVAMWARRVGRDYAYHGGGGAVDAVFGGPDLPSQQIDDETADEQVTIQFVPPRNLTPAQGGVLLREKVTDDHKVAWLTQQSIDGWFDMGKDAKKLTWSAPKEKWSSAPAPLQRIFTGRASVSLGKYDKKFHTGWKLIDGELAHWRKTSGLWDAEAEQRSERIRHRIANIGALGALAGAVALYFTASGPLLLALAVAGVSGVLTGLCISAAANAEELRVRTPAGFAQRQLVAGFLRFFQQSESKHAKEAADRGELRLYSAWAVALGELDAWDRAMSAAALPPDTPGVAETAYYSSLHTSVNTATTPPSSSGSSGGGSSSFSSSGGGSVGGGSGGGGGGSW